MNPYFEVCYRPKTDPNGWAKTAIVRAPNYAVAPTMLEHALGYEIICSNIIFAGPIYLLQGN